MQSATCMEFERLRKELSGEAAKLHHMACFGNTTVIRNEGQDNKTCQNRQSLKAIAI